MYQLLNSQNLNIMRIGINIENCRAKTIVLCFLCVSLLLQSCSTTRYVDYYVSCLEDFNNTYLDKDKNYIIEHFHYPMTDIKHLDDHYEILVFERNRNSYVGKGVTNFYMRNGTCYKIDTNEYTIKRRLEEVSFWDLLNIW